MTQVVKFAENDQIILSDDEHQMIINKFPKKLQTFLENVNNPLDETQILVNLFKDKGVRIVWIREESKFEDLEIVPYYHAGDIAVCIKYSSNEVTKWNSRWKIKMISYENLLRQNVLTTIDNKHDKKIDNKALFISEQELKKILIKVNTSEAIMFQDWLLEQSTITKKIFDTLIQIKHQQELEKKDIENAQLKKQLEAKTLSEKDIMQLSLNAVKLFPKSEREVGTIYIATSPDYQKKYTYKIGLTTTNKKLREASMQTSNPDINIIHTIDTMDVRLAEGIIHEFLRHLNYEKEFFYVSSLEKAKEIVTFITNFVNDCVNKYDNDNELLQKLYIDNKSKDTKIELFVPPANRSRSRSPARRTAIKPVLQITEKDKYKQYLDERTQYSDKHIHTSTLYDDFKQWFSIKTPNNNVPSNREFAKELKKYHTIENVRVGTKLTTGIKNLHLINDKSICDV